MIKATKYIILTFLAISFLISCTVERKLANDFLYLKDSLSVLIIPPDQVFKTNLKTWEIEDFEDMAEREQEDTLYNNSRFLKDVDDSIFFDSYFTGFQRELATYGVNVYYQNQIVDFLGVNTTAYQVALVQIELEEDIYPYRAEEIFDDTIVYYEDFLLNTINVNNWYEITKFNDPLAVNNLLYTSHYLLDDLEGRFVNNIFTGEVKFKSDITPIEVDKIYQFAEILGEKYAGYVFDYILNEYIHRNIGNNVRPKTYFHYDPQFKTLYPAEEDRFIFMEN